MDLFIDDANKKIAEQLVTVRLAVLYTQLHDEYDTEGKKDSEKRNQLVLAQIPDSKAKQEALEIRGGKVDTSKLYAMADAITLKAQNIHDSTENALDNGSNSRAEGINKQVADYLEANNG